ncbi:hypothetical protein JOC37_002436 [Desulfohalotomaculum tongense]|uniref:hypothetical protein n=1 Tax=Desulforadius tongensis TaxID=1216062 RepID=UPI0019561389|nr:hypothetical protein [Desulforadius tongensis]MBM7856013.1 hypothetical protein [Desulforadius tongensis]
MNKKKILIAFIFLMILLIPGTALAGVSVQARPGLNGLYKDYRPVQLTVSIANNGEAVEDAVLVVKVDEDKAYAANDKVVYRRVVDIPANQRIETTMIIPGQLAKTKPVVSVVAGDKVLASTVLQGMAVGSDSVVVSVGEKPLSGGLPSWLDSEMEYVTVKYLSPDDIPTNPVALDLADVIVMEKEKVEKLTPAQVKAVRQWVTLGGNLVLSGGAGAAAGQPFADISPVLVTGETTLSGDWNGMRSGTASIPVARGTLIQGKNILSQGDIPLVASHIMGRGRVIYCAAGFENLQAKDKEFWKLLFQQFNGNKSIKYDIDERIFRGDDNIFPQLQMPSIKLMIGVWVAYMLVVSPVIYLLLKRYKKRDWAWFFIPALALATASIIYYRGPFHRLDGPLSHNLTVVEILDQHVAEIQATGLFISPRGESLSLKDSGLGLVVPRSEYYGKERWSTAVVQYTGQGQEIYFQDVEFWSMRRADAYKVAENIGKIDGSLKLTGDRITGTLKNNSALDLVKCIAVIGDKVIEIGELPAGDSVKINQPVKGVKFFSWEYDVNKWFNNMRTAHQEKFGRMTYQVEDGLNGFMGSSYPGLGVKLIGYSKNIPGLMTLNGSGAQNYYSILVLQDLPLTLPETGAFRLPPGFVTPHIIDGSKIEYTPEGPQIQEGQVTLEYNLTLPERYQFDIRAVELSSVIQNTLYETKIYNWADEQWVNLKIMGKRLEGAELKPYLSEDNRFRLKIKKRSLTDRDVMPLPDLAVEGVIK